MATTVSLSKLCAHGIYPSESKKFINQIATNGWCRINELNTSTPIKPATDIVSTFFNAPLNQKTTYSNCEENIGYISSSTNERVRVLTGNIYQNLIDSNNCQLASNIIDNKLCSSMDEIALKIFKMICKYIIKKDWIKISSENEICLTRNYFYSYKICKFIASNWSKHEFICDDIILLISSYFSAQNMETFNYAMFEAIKYNKPLQNDDVTKKNELYSVNEHFDVGFCALGIGETCKGLQLFDKIKNKYIDADFSNNCIYIWIGSKLHELCDGTVPVGIHRVKWYNKKRISYLYEICVGQQIASLSFHKNENLQKPYKCLKEIIVPNMKQNELFQNVIIGKTRPIHIAVKSLNGNKNEMIVDALDTVKAVKLILQEKEGIPCERLRIIFKGKLLKDTDILSDKGVENGMTLHSAIMLRNA